MNLASFEHKLFSASDFASPIKILACVRKLAIIKKIIKSAYDFRSLIFSFYMIFLGDKCFQRSLKSLYFNVTHEKSYWVLCKIVYLI